MASIAKDEKRAVLSFFLHNHVRQKGILNRKPRRAPLQYERYNPAAFIRTEIIKSFFGKSSFKRSELRRHVMPSESTIERPYP